MAKNRRHDIVKPSKFKTSLCSFFQSEEGCPFGDTCAFAHGEADLRPEEEVVKPKPAATEEAAADGATKSADKVQGGAKKTNNSNNNKNNKPGNRQGNKNYAKAQGKEGAYDNSAAYSSYFAMNGGYYIPPGVGHEPYYNINAVHGVNTMNPLVFPTTYPSSSPHGSWRTMPTQRQ
ncbi:hypothetical protein AGDE_15962 [Angomonas deanei]|uniref:Zinc finger C-x8-C-x5-C-x3-H type (And similar), putative n=1 Tax=Angomonas deanei TaxID=59799 RepID=A0A7G2CS80_9TRYP|nr:hypothetical protein AGDE_15962 [Angomonas deanei]CAD2221834.1 Zinc finger C-x8-C-x5-C-x3-H type (and similar), putative [Angomonas deanei]|eukprot:EPY18058.1 hypothetical protein AGDE_15962 [Angomonas deanei]